MGTQSALSGSIVCLPEILLILIYKIKFLVPKNQNVQSFKDRR